MPVNNIMRPGVDEDAYAAGHSVFLETLAAGLPVCYVDESGITVMEQPDGRRYEIRWIPGAPYLSKLAIGTEDDAAGARALFVGSAFATSGTIPLIEAAHKDELGHRFAEEDKSAREIESDALRLRHDDLRGGFAEFAIRSNREHGDAAAGGRDEQVRARRVQREMAWVRTTKDCLFSSVSLPAGSAEKTVTVASFCSFTADTKRRLRSISGCEGFVFPRPLRAAPA
jgi:hypothetical protein